MYILLNLISVPRILVRSDELSLLFQINRCTQIICARQMRGMIEHQQLYFENIKKYFYITKTEK